MEPRKPLRRTYFRVNRLSPDWSEQQRKLDALRLKGRTEATGRYRKKRAKRLLTAAEEPIRFHPGPPERPVKGAVRLSGPFRTYSMTINTIVELHRSQNGRCAICLDDIETLGRSRAVDHDHKTGKVRGMLCKSCNVGLGCFRDDPKRLLAAMVYLGHLDKKFLPIEHVLNSMVRHPIETKLR